MSIVDIDIDAREILRKWKARFSQQGRRHVDYSEAIRFADTMLEKHSDDTGQSETMSENDLRELLMKPTQDSEPQTKRKPKSKPKKRH